MASGSQTWMRELGALAHDPAEDQQGAEGDLGLRQLVGDGGAVDVEDAESGDIEVFHEEGEKDQAHEEADIAEAGDHEGLFAGLGGGEFFIPEADQQIGGQAHQLPGDE